MARIRSLPPEEVANEEAELSAAQAQVELGQVEVLLELFDHPGWEVFATLVQREEANAIAGLLTDTTQSMEQVVAYRARRRVLRWILDMPGERARQRAQLLELLKGEE